jgi:protein-tyrosine phosphatase
MKRELQAALEGASGLLFVCSGNMIRSAFAELYARHLGAPLRLRSAGTIYPNSAIHPRAGAALEARGVPASWSASFRPTLLRDLEPRSGDVLLGMTQRHLADARGQGFEGPSFLILAALSSEAEVPDPYFEGGYDEVFDALERATAALLAEVQRGSGGASN